MGSLFTIGCSIHKTDDFIDILKNYNINVIADVRSVPFSKYTPQFNQNVIKQNLNNNNIHYLFFGEEFGARRKEKESYTNGIVDFKKVIDLPIFKTGIERIKIGLEKNFNIALLCTEKRPLDCHRFLLVSNTIHKKLMVKIDHILFNGKIISQDVLEQQMLNELGLSDDLFTTLENRLESAYDILGRKISFNGNEEEHYE